MYICMLWVLKEHQGFRWQSESPALRGTWDKPLFGMVKRIVLSLSALWGISYYSCQTLSRTSTCLEDYALTPSSILRGRCLQPLIAAAVLPPFIRLHITVHSCAFNWSALPGPRFCLLWQLCFQQMVVMEGHLKHFRSGRFTSHSKHELKKDPLLGYIMIYFYVAILPICSVVSNSLRPHGL